MTAFDISVPCFSSSGLIRSTEGLASWRLKLTITACASKGPPSWNFASRRRWNIHSFPSVLMSQLCARARIPGGLARPITCQAL